MGIRQVFQILALRLLIQLRPENIGLALGRAVLKTPNSILIPALQISRLQANILHQIPGLKDVDIAKLPFIGPMLRGVQSALATRAAVDTAKQSMDQFAHGMVTVHSPMPFESAVSAAGQHLLDRKSDALSGASTGASFLAAQAQALGGKLEKLEKTAEQEAAQAGQDLTPRTRTSTFIP
ncbi:hypothetical protein PG985_013040 [Apiospora marii]|uniref:Uncharacterized protein n=1 Tax=Apiospora marii TaxID=335849 RepID=A0ABR1RCG8_9PEZI